MTMFSEGVAAERLRRELLCSVDERLDDGIYSIKQEVIRRILTEGMLTLERNIWFFGDLHCGSATAGVRDRLQELFLPEIADTRLRRGEELRAYWGLWDYGHTAPNWENVLTLGLSGLRERAESKLLKGENNEEQAAFARMVVSHYDAAFTMLRRMAALAKRAQPEDRQMISALESLCHRPPETLYEAMQTMIVFFVLQSVADDNYVRSFGRLDALLHPYYQRDLKAGRLTPEEGRLLTRKFLERLAQFRMAANIPFAICGESLGRDRSNAYTHVLLREFIALSSPDLKIHFLYAKSTPRELVEMAAAAIIAGSNSIVFMNDGLIQPALEGLGIEPEDAREYQVVGCYEPCAREEVCCSCNGILNLGKAVEVAMNGGRDMTTGELIGVEIPDDFQTFGEFYAAFCRQLEFFAEAAMALTRAREAAYPLVSTGGFLSSTLDHCMEKASDAYAGFGAKYENASINANGLATAADSLLAVKKLVFAEKRISFSELSRLMRENWQSDPTLRLWIRNRLDGYGTNNPEADGIAADILKVLSGCICNAPNSKGGVFRLGAFSVDNRYMLGEQTAATPDGRAAGEPLSKNLGANLWADRQGVTAHVLSAAKLQGQLFPNGSVLDLVLHRSAVRGTSGRENFLKLLEVFMARGGFAVHFNVLDPAALRDAQKNPEKYPNLQIRRCGWNVCFHTLSKREQDEFIYASEKQS